MKHFNKISTTRIVFTLFLVISTNLIHSQTKLFVIEDKDKAKKISNPITIGNSLLVFESTQDLSFESSVENIKSPTRQNDKYYLEVKSGPQVITIKNNNGSINIPFGQAIGENYDIALQPKEIRYFKIEERKVLKYSNITDSEKASGTNILGVGLDPSDAIIFLKFSSSNLKVEIEDPKNVISKKSPEPNGDLILFIKMNDIPADSKKNIVLNLKEEEYGITEMKIFDLSRKELRFYLIEKISTVPQPPIPTIDLVALKLTRENSLSPYKKFAGPVPDKIELLTEKEFDVILADAKKAHEEESKRIAKAQKKDQIKADLRKGFSSLGIQSGEIAKYGLLYEYGGKKTVGFHISARTSLTSEDDILKGTGVENKTEFELGPNFRLSNRLYFNVGAGYGYYDKVVNNDYAGTLALEKTGYLVATSGLMYRISRVININGGVSFMDIYNAFYKPEITFGVSFNLKK